MTENILNILRAQNNSHLSAIYIANQLHASMPVVVGELLALRKLGNVRAWGCGTPYMKYWSI